MALCSILKGRRLILASNSPRRKQLLQQINLTPDIIPSSFIENLDKSTFSSPSDYAIANAAGKAQDVYKDVAPESIVLGSDTVVVIDDRILEKPKDDEHAVTMLRALSGRTHSVVTGVSIITRGVAHSFSVSTNVRFSVLSEELIQWYVGTGEPLDKAGGYGIQGVGAVLVEGVEGCYNNVVGLPLQQLFVEMHRVL